ncbi:MAG: ABC transporter permease [Notoacmeibacter sp.]|nr:ABC transporter permease [Notoacmeibacter sp.]
MPENSQLSTNLNSMIQIAAFGFLINYRKTMVGPLWLLIGPSLFIVVLGGLYAKIGATEPDKFIPHLSVGLICWTLITSFTNQAPTVFQRARTQILQAGLSLDNIAMLSIITSVIIFIHQIPIILVVFFLYGISPTFGVIQSLVGLVFLIASGVWVTRLLAILGARFRDLSEIVQAIMRIAFLVTPILWMPAVAERGGALGHYLLYNPFFHFIEVVRAPLLGNTVEVGSWIVVLVVTAAGNIFTHFFSRSYLRFVPLWI